ncbi:MAG: hypothetical protein JOZ50_00895 [Candidatus Eremiobacteraeota bacterium]|nr:hypothetical protein [Candidatus Eremiobacteraeota bacterium]
MSTQSSSHRAALRTFFVVALSLLVLVGGGLDFRRIWIPIGLFGYQSNGDQTVFFVADGSPAAKSGMQISDKIDLQSTPVQFRYFAAQGATLQAGQKVTFSFIHGGTRRTVTLSSVPQVTEHYYAAYRVAVLCVATLFIFLGAALVLLRPSLMTWGFFLYCLGNAPFTFFAVTLWYPYPWPYVEYNVQSLVIDAGVVGLLVFALCFLNEPLRDWRRSALRAMPVLLALLAMLSTAWGYCWGWIGGPPGELLSRIYIVVQAAWSLAVMYLFVDTYVRARGADRQRIRWVVVGFGLNLIALFINQFTTQYVPNSPIWLFHILQLSTVIVPLTVAYAVVRHRVIDVSFVVSRTLVYAVLTTMLVGVFSLIDWFFTDYLRLARLGTFAEVGAVVAFGLWFNGLHKRVDSFIDATFFRQRHKAEVQLARTAAALPLATTPKIVAHALVAEPVRTLSLASAALFQRDANAVFIRQESEGWEPRELGRLDDSDGYFLTLLQAENGPLSLYDHPWRTEGVPSGPARPVLALPIFVRREVAAIVFYGSHVHGEPLDPDEIKAIAGLAMGASVAYDHLEAEAMKREVETVRRENESLRSVIAEAQIQPA